MDSVYSRTRVHCHLCMWKWASQQPAPPLPHPPVSLATLSRPSTSREAPLSDRLWTSPNLVCPDPIPAHPHSVALGTLPLSAHCRSYRATGAASGQGRPRSHIWCRLSTRERTWEHKHFSCFLLSWGVGKIVIKQPFGIFWGGDGFYFRPEW